MTQATKPLGKLGKYEILAELGSGNFGVVYRARDTMLEREVALKVIHPTLLVNAGLVQRFLAEARVVARLDHPNIVPVHDVVEAEGRLFLVMKLLQGRTLEKAIKDQGRLEPGAAVSILEQLADAVDYAHGQGVLHRDLKPANVMLRDDGRATLTDFGLARALAESYADSAEKQAGTLSYMAPEQFDAGFGEVGAAADLYSLGVMAYEMLGGRVPFTGTYTQVMHGHLMVLPPPLTGMPPRVDDALHGALAKKPEDRFGSAGEFVAALREAIKPTADDKAESTVISQVSPAGDASPGTTGEAAAEQQVPPEPLLSRPSGSGPPPPRRWP